MVLRSTSKYRYGNGQKRFFWGCCAYPKCKGVHGAHPDGTPLGIPANLETKRWRQAAHELFDQLWKSGAHSREEAYEELQRRMKMTKEEAHIGRFTKEQCIELIRQLYDHGV
jgi:ssDNA-binding Zn-finger/Zn-ribbon topoisomerase 1